IQAMRENLCQDLEADISQVNVKATTTEKLGFEGRKEGISSHAVVIMSKQSA
ncbi:MAG: 2-C-methyl-D-erythritol 2,4-cyclodiphosphate synthase, partial [Pseudomonadota bacterium]